MNDSFFRSSTRGFFVAICFACICGMRADVTDDLWKAISENDPYVAADKIAAGADVNRQFNDGGVLLRTPFHLALRNGWPVLGGQFTRMFYNVMLPKARLLQPDEPKRNAIGYCLWEDANNKYNTPYRKLG